MLCREKQKKINKNLNCANHLSAVPFSLNKAELRVVNLPSFNPPQFSHHFFFLRFHGLLCMAEECLKLSFFSFQRNVARIELEDFSLGVVVWEIITNE